MTWTKVKLGNYIDVFTGYPFKSKEFNIDGLGMRLVRGKNVTKGNLRWGDDTRYWEDIDENTKKYLLKEDDVVIGMDGSLVGQNYTRIKKGDLPLLLVQRVAALRAKKDINQKYIYYLIDNTNFINYVSSIKTGTSIPHISAKQIKEFEFFLPPYQEQIRIVELLEPLYQKIEVNNNISKSLNDIANAIFKNWFLDFDVLDVDGLSFKTSNDKLVDSELGLIPKGWEIKKIGDFINITDYVANGSFASLKENVNTSDANGYAILIRLVDYKRNFKGPFVYVDEKGYNFLKKSKLNGGEIIISNVGANAGTVFKAPKLEKPMTLGPNSIMLEDNKYNNFIYYYLTSHNGQESIKGILGGSAQPKFNKTDFRNLKIILPSDTIIENFNKIMDPVVSRLQTVSQENNKIKTLRDSLLTKLIAGEIRIPKAEEEVEECLQKSN
ncbi:restriction endonuclease subunit S [Fictibacillus sp. b24]|uniref:restriction endonuclease subunit S n=1 Tax=Fictibacillus sp. b24 TaxID=3055863 RepID=UPI0025A0C7A8|nr:restriction endonuclease subunit S [Fictibacillus sp. b24]MDM5318245.1 restriction endonuclease subunit S [Fictibacillus sp. b24]